MKRVHILCLCRQECKKLREELREEHEEDKRAALTQLAQAKDQELGSARESWQRKVEDLLEQVSDMRLSQTHTPGIQDLYTLFDERLCFRSHRRCTRISDQ